MSLGSRTFVAMVFAVLGVSFVVTTATLMHEFRDLDWFSIAAFYSHLFIFFPTVGLLALAAFFVPAAVFVDLYWSHVRWGRIRFAVGTLLLVALSLLLTRVILSGAVPAIWELQPETIAGDQGNPRRCAETKVGSPESETDSVLLPNRCKRVPVMDALLAVRAVSQKRTGLSPFVRDCKPDPFIEPSPENALKRYCFPNKQFQAAAECCAAQAVLSQDLTDMYAAEDGQHSRTGRLHRLLLPLKVFFLLVVLVIGILLAVWRKEVDRHFPAHASRIERGVLVGAIAMLLWPITNHAFIQAATVLYGGYGDGAYAKMSPLFSAIFGMWALLLIMFFFRQHERDLEAAGKIFGGVASVIAVMKYNQIIDYSVRFVGSGSDAWEVLVLCGLIVAAFAALIWAASTPEAATPPRISGMSAGGIPATAPGASSGTTPGASSGATPGASSGATSGASSGATSGATAGLDAVAPAPAGPVATTVALDPPGGQP